MKISVVGTGAVGGYYGMMLAKAGNDVHFLLRSDYEYVKEHGLKLHSDVHSDISLPDVNAYTEPSTMPEADVVLVGLKTTQNRSALIDILPQVVHKESIVVLIQNGMGMEDDLAVRLPQLQIAGAIALIGAHKEGDGYIIHQDYGKLDIGNYNVRDPSRLSNLSARFEAAGVPSSVGNLEELRWRKLVWNMPFNGLSVALNRNTEQLLANEDSLLRSKAIMNEVVYAARAGGVNLPDELPDQMIAFTRKMRPYFPSMKLDFDYKRPMELEYMYRRPIEISRANGFEMKECMCLLDEAKRLEEGRG